MGFFTRNSFGNKLTKKSSDSDDDEEGKYGYEYDNDTSYDEKRGKKGTKKPSFRWGSIVKQNKGSKYFRNSSLTQETTRTTGTTIICQNDQMNKFSPDDHNNNDNDTNYFDSDNLRSRFSRSHSDNNIDDDDDDDSKKSEDECDDEESIDEQQLDRATVRLDGIEVYAIVSALTCATSISCFDNFDPTPIDVILKEYAVFTFFAEVCYYASGAVGMMTGLHATLIFSLVTMYGRTALGIDRDDAFNDFFAGTGGARFNGFKSFKISLYSFILQLTVLIEMKFVFTPLRPLVLLGTGYLAYTNMYVDSEAVLAAAGVIYAPPKPPVVEEKKPESIAINGTDKVGPKKRRSSLSRVSLSTRNFGVDSSKDFAKDEDEKKED